MNWRQEVAHELAGIEDLNRNTATLLFTIFEQNPFDSSKETETVISRSVTVKAPEKVSAFQVDGKVYQTGDLIMEIDYLTLLEARKPRPDDPEGMVIDTLRPYAPETGGIKPGEERVNFSGTEYLVVDIAAAKWLENEPALWKLTLRRT